MSRSSFSAVFKFLLGILLVQAATVVLVMAAVRAGIEDTWVPYMLLALITGFFVALWFGSIADHVKKDAVARVKEDFSQEREKIRVRAEKEKTKVIKQSHQQIAKETKRVHAKASFKVGAAFAGLVGLGAIMLLTQFVTVGLLTLSTAGGALVGYVVRVRQELLSRKRKEAEQVAGEAKPVSAGGVKLVPPAINGRLKKSN